MEQEPCTSRREECLSPRQKRPRVPFSATEKMMLRNVYKYVWEEKSAECVKEYEFNMRIKSECVAKTADILGISTNTVYNILKEYKENQKFKIPGKTGPKRDFRDKLSDSDFEAIKGKVQRLLDANEIPTISKVHKAVLDDPELPNFSKSTMNKILSHLKKIQKNNVHATVNADELIVEPEIVLVKVEYSDDDDNS